MAHRNRSSEIGTDNGVVIIKVIVIMQDVSVLYNMFVYIIIYSHVYQNSCGVKRLCRRIAPLVGRRLAPLGLF